MQAYTNMFDFSRPLAFDQAESSNSPDSVSLTDGLPSFPLSTAASEAPLPVSSFVDTAAISSYPPSSDMFDLHHSSLLPMMSSDSRSNPNGDLSYIPSADPASLSFLLPPESSDPSPIETGVTWGYKTSVPALNEIGTSHGWGDLPRGSPGTASDSPFLAVEVIDAGKLPSEMAFYDPLQNRDTNTMSNALSGISVLKDTKHCYAELIASSTNQEENSLFDTIKDERKVKRRRSSVQSVPFTDQDDGKRFFPCEQCNKSFSRLNNLHAHLRIHTGEKPFACETCDKHFARRSGLSRHLRIHTGEKPLECPQCKKTFADSSNLSRHLRLHSGERPFECNVCLKRFSWKSSLIWHVRSHTSE